MTSSVGMDIPKVDFVSTIGIGGGVTVACTLLCSLTMLPMVVLFMGDLCPFLVYRLSGRGCRCCRRLLRRLFFCRGSKPPGGPADLTASSSGVRATAPLLLLQDSVSSLGLGRGVGDEEEERVGGNGVAVGVSSPRPLRFPLGRGRAGGGSGDARGWPEAAQRSGGSREQPETAGFRPPGDGLEGRRQSNARVIKSCVGGHFESYF